MFNWTLPVCVFVWLYVLLLLLCVRACLLTGMCACVRACVRARAYVCTCVCDLSQRIITQKHTRSAGGEFVWGFQLPDGELSIGKLSHIVPRLAEFSETYGVTNIMAVTGPKHCREPALRAW